MVHQRQCGQFLRYGAIISSFETFEFCVTGIPSTYLGTSRGSDGECKHLGCILVTIQLELSERSSVTFNWLGNTPIPAVQLHSTLYFERRRVGSVSGNTNKHKPFLVSTGAVVDDLRADKGWMAVEDLLRRGRRVGDGPVVHCGLRHEAEGRVVDPLPEDNVLVIDVRLDFLLRLDVKHLKCATG